MKSNEKTIKEMRQAIVTYTGPVTRYPPGKARAPAKSVVKKNTSDNCVKPIPDRTAVRRQMRILRARQSRIAERNAAINRRLGER